MEVSDVVNELKRFLIDPKCDHRWISGNMLEVYVRKRKAQMLFYEDTVSTLDIANIACEDRGRGIFTAFLDEAEQISPYPIFVELIHNRRLRSFLLRRGYTIMANYDRGEGSSREANYHAFRPLKGHKYWYEEGNIYQHMS